MMEREPFYSEEPYKYTTEGGEWYDSCIAKEEWERLWDLVCKNYPDMFEPVGGVPCWCSPFLLESLKRDVDLLLGKRDNNSN